MVTPELVAYIWSERKKRVADHIIKASLAARGWNEQDFAEAVAALPPPNIQIDPKMGSTVMSSLGENVVWRTPDGKADLPSKPIIKRHRWIIKAIAYAVVACILIIPAYIFRDEIAIKLLETYYIHEQMVSEWLTVVRLATDFSH